ncbi:Protein N-acetyltransferase, RimJ/RimL family [Parapedobacter luteus]|uniref:Protein N-acetyltransferase, RimJ/RimL family n=1 Tax=Parapedobacter luteus TaxID=623280 RepID=A0A1T5AEP8_9SPHI|nr:GNAT family N-acetyltransferase [Parapedobacter luteus]SKB33502.1 Protein N-acetyltransferase, RimJ/RimL family [Parapedobacter luteus]
MNTFPIPPLLQNDRAILLPLLETDFEVLYALASDPVVWAQHPQPDRWKASVFRIFFNGAINSKGAFKVIDRKTGAVAGSTRFYDYDAQNRSIFIGYTFYAARYWGTGLNAVVKKLMLDYAFRYVDTVLLHVGAANIRSQKAVKKLGARKIAEVSADYHGDGPKPNFTYEIRREDWGD